ncbi:MAG: hypothetical protein NC346_09035 [Prevotella sp.]|nr:hypothetical protein [Prevotella sp.]MCM1443666.1 hypothetical protein [Muribaculum sp.]MCM1577151.1 hypothetical protein [Bacteroides sp.]
MSYKVKIRSDVFTQNTTVNPSDFGGWMCVNSGTTDVQVLKIVLQPGEGLDYTSLQPNVIWDSPIPIVLMGEGGQVTMHRLIYKDK